MQRERRCVSALHDWGGSTFYTLVKWPLTFGVICWHFVWKINEFEPFQYVIPKLVNLSINVQVSHFEKIYIVYKCVTVEVVIFWRNKRVHHSSSITYWIFFLEVSHIEKYFSWGITYWNEGSNFSAGITYWKICPFRYHILKLFTFGYHIVKMFLYFSFKRGQIAPVTTQWPYNYNSCQCWRKMWNTFGSSIYIRYK